MADNKIPFDWQTALIETYTAFTKQVIDHIPQLLGAVMLLIAGWIVALLLRLLIRKLIRGLDALLSQAARKRGLQRAHVRSYAKLSGDIVFWSVLLFFVAASASMLGWEIFSGVTDALLTYLPNVLTGLLIILAGFALGGVSRSAVSSTAESTGIAQADLLARIAQVTVVFTAIIIGVEQLGINVAFLTTTLVVVAGVVLGGAALAFGLGAKSFVANVIGAQTMRKYHQVGQHFKIDTVEGILLEITPTTIVLDTELGRTTVPAKLFNEQVSQIIVEPPEESGSLIGNLFSKKADPDDAL